MQVSMQDNRFLVTGLFGFQVVKYMKSFHSYYVFGIYSYAQSWCYTLGLEFHNH